MTGDPKYILDANVFIEAARRYYAFDIVPRFWAILIDLAVNEQILSIDRVKKEVEKGKDQLAQWASKDFDFAFASTNREDVTESYGEVMTWVQSQVQFTNGAKADFAKGADGWLVAYAKLKAYVVVTHEELSLDKRVKVPIPNVCSAFKVDYCDTFKMLRTLGVKIA